MEEENSKKGNKYFVWRNNPVMGERLKELALAGTPSADIAIMLSKEFKMKLSTFAIERARSRYVRVNTRKYKWRDNQKLLDRLKQLIEEGKFSYSQIADILSQEFKEIISAKAVGQISNDYKLNYKARQIETPLQRKAQLISSIGQEKIIGQLLIEEKKIHEFLRDHRTTLEQLSVLIDKSIPSVQKSIKALVEKGFDVRSLKGEYFIPRIPMAASEKSHLIQFYNDKFRFGIVGDTQLGSKFQQITHLNKMYDIYAEEEIEHVYHLGDLVDGEDVYYGQEYELFARGAEEQKDYVIKNYPQRDLKNGKKMKTHIIAGNHDLSFYKAIGYDIVKAICEKKENEEGREDLEYLGQWDAIIKTKNKIKIHLLHPDSGGAYALSYKGQKIIEGYSSENKPNLLFLGHWHTSLYMFLRNIHCIYGGCFQSQTPYLRRKGLMPQVGGWICEINIGPDGSVNRFKSEFIPFFEHISNDF